MSLAMSLVMNSSMMFVFSPVLGFGIPGGYEWIILLILGLLIFGRRLPEVGRSLGRSIVEFKKGIRSIEDEIDTESSRSKPAEPPEIPASAPSGELPRTNPPAEPRVNRDPLAAAGLDDGEREPVEQSVEQPATGPTDPDSTSG